MPNLSNNHAERQAEPPAALDPHCLVGLAVIGCDDIAAAAWVSPALTTVAQQKGEMGRLAVEHLISLLDNPDQEQAASVLRLPMLLRIRETTGPAPAASRPR